MIKFDIKIYYIWYKMEMEKCHECAEVVEKLNKEYDELHKEKEFYKSKMNMKNEFIKQMIEEEKEQKYIYIKKLNEHIHNNDRNYNIFLTCIGNIDRNIIELLKQIK